MEVISNNVFDGNLNGDINLHFIVIVLLLVLDINLHFRYMIMMLRIMGHHKVRLEER